MTVSSNQRLVENPFIKSENRSRSVVREVQSTQRSVSPPPLRKQRSITGKPSTAQVEAGVQDVQDHLQFFSEKLLSFTRDRVVGEPRLNHSKWVDLYMRNLNANDGHHFVIHQHDHPIAGTHYDLRLQCNPTSSISFAIMYGLPGNPNSRRPNRNATETRVHNLWNHLIETASHQTGTMLLWDTGEYEVLQYRDEAQHSAHTTDDDDDDSEEKEDLRDELGRYDQAGLVSKSWTSMTQQEKIRVAFRSRKIRLRLNGTRLPKGYTISLRLTTSNFRDEQPIAPKKRRRRLVPGTTSMTKARKKLKVYNTDSSTSGDEIVAVNETRRARNRKNLTSLKRRASPPLSDDENNNDDGREYNQGQVNSEKISTSRYDTTLTDRTVRWEDDSSLDGETEFPSELRPIKKTATEASNNKQSWNHHERTRTQTRTPKQKESEREREEKEKDALIQQTNAYPGAINDINSIHQRRWYLSLDKKNSGFIESRLTNLPDSSTTSKDTIPRWIPRGLSDKYQQKQRDQNANANAGSNTPSLSSSSSTSNPKTRIPNPGFNPFIVRGRDHERSILTGRLARDILCDEKVEGFIPRGLWRAIVE